MSSEVASQENCTGWGGGEEGLHFPGLFLQPLPGRALSLTLSAGQQEEEEVEKQPASPPTGSQSEPKQAGAAASPADVIRSRRGCACVSSREGEPSRQRWGAICARVCVLAASPGVRQSQRRQEAGRWRAGK